MQSSPVRTLSILALASLATATSASAQCANLWPVGENGTINGNDKAAGIVVWGNPDDQSSDEYVFVAGTRATGPGTSEIVVCKYDVGCGNLIWRQTYAGPASGIHEAVDINIGFQQFQPSPNAPNGWKEWYVYVTGVSYGSATGLDYVTLKINAQENTDLDTSNIQADGSFSTRWPVFGPGHDDYDPNDPNWAHAVGVRRYTNTAVNGGEDRPVRIGVDGRDNIDEGWTAARPGDIWIFGTSFGGSPAQGGTGKDYAIIHYDADGRRAWLDEPIVYANQDGAMRYDHADGDDVAADLCFKSHAQPNTSGLPGLALYVTGTVYSGAATQNDYGTLMYDADSGELDLNSPNVVQIYDSGHGGNDVAVAMDSPLGADIVVTGTSDEPPSLDFFDPPTVPPATDYLTVCYIPNFVSPPSTPLLWEERFDFDDYDQAVDVQTWMDGSAFAGTVWVTGAVASTSFGATDFGTVKYVYEQGTSNVEADWDDRLDFASGNDRPASLRTDHLSCSENGNYCGILYVTGSTVRNGTTDYVTFRYESDKTYDPLEWPRYYNGLGNGADAAVRLDFSFQGLALSGHPTVFTVGTSAGSGTLNDIVTHRILQP